MLLGLSYIFMMSDILWEALNMGYNYYQEVHTPEEKLKRLEDGPKRRNMRRKTI